MLKLQTVIAFSESLIFVKCLAIGEGSSMAQDITLELET